jgi:hypothetical protein
MRRRSALRMIFAGLLSVLALGLATTVATPALAEVPDSAKAEWQARYRSLLDSVSEAASRYQAAKAIYTKNRQINRKRGDARFDINTELSEAQIELADARAALEDFPDEAHRAGVPPGWLREVEDTAGAAAPR